MVANKHASFEFRDVGRDPARSMPESPRKGEGAVYMPQKLEFRGIYCPNRQFRGIYFSETLFFGQYMPHPFGKEIFH